MDNSLTSLTKTNLCLGAIYLDATELAVVRDFIKTCRNFNENFCWVFAIQPPFDVVVVDGDYLKHAGLRGDQLPGRVVVLANENPDQLPNILMRPLTFNELESFFNLLAFEIYSRRSTCGTLNVSEKLTKFHGNQPIYKLLRWPETDFLQQDPLRVRISTVLSKGPTTVQDLANICCLEIEKCEEILCRLELLGVLEVIQPTVHSPPPSAAAERIKAAPNTSPMLGRIGNLKGRLGW